MNQSETLATEIVTKLRANGHVAYFVGGCVRDRLLGIDSKDFDVATDASPDAVEALFDRTEAVGKSFGVILVKGADDVIEVATFRQDLEYRDGRRPDAVVFTTSAEQDVQRRDFTINGLLWDPLADQLVDYVGGQADLDAKIIRAIGDPSARFAEDKLRMLRAVRFAARLGFTIEPETMRAIQEHAAGIDAVAPERIRQEINRILTEGGARRGFELLDESGLLAQILPEVRKLQGVEQPPQYHPEGDVWTHTMIMIDGLEAGCSLTLALGVLLHDIGKPDTQTFAVDRIRFNGHVERGMEIAEEILTRLRYSRAEMDQAIALIAGHMKFMHLRDMRESKLKRFLRQDRFEEHLELHRLDCTSSNGFLENWEYAGERFSELGEEKIRPRPLVTGNDLIAAGYKPGPEFREWLEAAEDAQLEGRIASTEEGLRLIEELVSR